MTVRFPLVLLPVLAVVPAVLILGRMSAARLPQVASGSDILSVVFGDAKSVLSVAMAQKADSYFHGGVDMDHHEAHFSECDRDTSHRPVLAAASALDPWRWLNERVRAPEVERHLEGIQAVELLPWFWASVKANPHNVEAWTETWYVAAHVMKDRVLARRVLDEAKRANPDAPEIALTEGQFLYDRGRGDVLAAEKAFRRAQALVLARAGGDAAKLDEADRVTYVSTENYLKDIVKKKGNEP